MARPRSVDVDHVLACARSAFARTGLKRTSIADIASAAGVSAGTLYNIAASKEALFLAVFLPSEQLRALPLPVPVPTDQELLDKVADRLRGATELPLLAQALRGEHVRDITRELTGIVGERYDAIAGHWQLLAAVEQTARDFPVVAREYFERGRQGQTDELAHYLQNRRAAGQLRAVESALAARFIVEAVAWWAWHRHEDQVPLPLQDQDARALVQDLVLHALLPA